MIHNKSWQTKGEMKVVVHSNSMEPFGPEFMRDMLLLDQLYIQV